MNVNRSRIVSLALASAVFVSCREEQPRVESASPPPTVQAGTFASSREAAIDSDRGEPSLIREVRETTGRVRELDWDAEIKEFYPQPGSLEVSCFYEVANNTSEAATISRIEPSCGCSIVKSPPLPWTLKPGDRDRIDLVIDLKGKHGVLTKAVKIASTFGIENLVFKVHIPEFSLEARATRTMRERLENMKLAAADRQAVFKGDCRRCHFDTAVGKKGETLFQAACGVCHDTPHRATMVPDLAASAAPRDGAYWRYWITTGKVDSLMPAFGEKDGGPLTEEQIDHLADYLTTRFEAVGAVRTGASD